MNRFQTKKENQKGFTLVETVIAILILSLSIGALLTLAAGGFFSVRYARNQIVADNLLQESLEYIRNSRDSAVLQGTPWVNWLQMLNVDMEGEPIALATPRGCFASDGCSVDPYTSIDPVVECNGACPPTIFFPTEGFYGYEEGEYPPFSDGTPPIETTYVRTIRAQLPTNVQLVITALITWKNGDAQRTTSQSMILTNWNQ